MNKCKYQFTSQFYKNKLDLKFTSITLIRLLSLYAFFEHVLFCHYFWILICKHFAGGNLAGKVGRDSYLENNVSVLRSLGERDEEFNIYFEWDEKEMGIPGAFYVTNLMNDEFFLVSMTLEYGEQDQNNIHFVCNSWVHNRKCYKTDRIFFANTVSQITIIVIYFHF